MLKAFKTGEKIAITFKNLLQIGHKCVNKISNQQVKGLVHDKFTRN